MAGGRGRCVFLGNEALLSGRRAESLPIAIEANSQFFAPRGRDRETRGRRARWPLTHDNDVILRRRCGNIYAVPADSNILTDYIQAYVRKA